MYGVSFEPRRKRMDKQRMQLTDEIGLANILVAIVLIVS